MFVLVGLLKERGGKKKKKKGEMRGQEKTALVKMARSFPSPALHFCPLHPEGINPSGPCFSRTEHLIRKKKKKKLKIYDNKKAGWGSPSPRLGRAPLPQDAAAGGCEPVRYNSAHLLQTLGY